MDWSEKVKILIDTLPFLRRFSGKTVVIKYGGHAMGDPELARQFALDIVLLKQIGLNPVVVH
ncbi:MAG: acetylglutamate kinase, partial [Alphaproteobacteria bacterium]|nr:acetylglutamate kinase [Alphaproteobacteria bacterium]